MKYISGGVENCETVIITQASHDIAYNSLAALCIWAYEQDFLDTKYLPATSLNDPEAFTDNMASAIAIKELHCNIA